MTSSARAFDLDFVKARAALRPRSLEVEWQPGAESPASYCGAMIQVHGWDERSYIIRQNPASNAEGPFQYLLIGEAKALVIDTGAPSAIWPDLFHRTVTELAARVPLIVTHTHKDENHCAGDLKFKGALKTASSGTIDLGGRTVTVLSTPGHSDADFCFYDEHTQWLLTGDLLYPGRVTIADWRQYRASVASLVGFSAAHPVSAILGSHIEMTRKPGKQIAAGATLHREEHGLALGVEHLAELHKLCDSTAPRRVVCNDFILIPK